MRITLKKINIFNEDFKKIKKLYNDAFPDDERMPIWILGGKTYKKAVDFWSLYHDGKWFGMAYVLNESNLSYLFYFAVSAEERGKGLGTAALQSLKRKYAGRCLFLALETLDEKAENYSERLKRRQFYLRNGLKPLDRQIREGKVIYDVMGTGGNVRPEEYESMMRNYFGFPLFGSVSMKATKKRNVPCGTF